jgi:hypothetical protein
MESLRKFFPGEILSSTKHLLYSLIIIHKIIKIWCTDTMLQLEVPEGHLEPDYSVVVIHVTFKCWLFDSFVVII